MDHPDPQWRVLSPEEVATVDERSVWIVPRSRVWVCNHCFDYVSPMSPQPFRCVLTKEEAVQHLQTVYVPIFFSTAFALLRFICRSKDTISTISCSTWIYSQFLPLSDISRYLLQVSIGDRIGKGAYGPTFEITGLDIIDFGTLCVFEIGTVVV